MHVQWVTFFVCSQKKSGLKTVSEQEGQLCEKCDKSLFSRVTSRSRVNFFLKRGLKAKSMRVSKVRAIVLDYIGINSIALDPAIPEIFYFKHDVRASNHNFYWQP